MSRKEMKGYQSVRIAGGSCKIPTSARKQGAKWLEREEEVRLAAKDILHEICGQEK